MHCQAAFVGQRQVYFGLFDPGDDGRGVHHRAHLRVDHTQGERAAGARFRHRLRGADHLVADTVLRVFVLQGLDHGGSTAGVYRSGRCV